MHSPSEFVIPRLCPPGAHLGKHDSRPICYFPSVVSVVRGSHLVSRFGSPFHRTTAPSSQGDVPAWSPPDSGNASSLSPTTTLAARSRSKGASGRASIRANVVDGWGPDTQEPRETREFHQVSALSLLGPFPAVDDVVDMDLEMEKMLHTDWPVTVATPGPDPMAWHGTTRVRGEQTRRLLGGPTPMRCSRRVPGVIPAGWTESQVQMRGNQRRALSLLDSEPCKAKHPSTQTHAEGLTWGSSGTWSPSFTAWFTPKRTQPANPARPAIPGPGGGLAGQADGETVFWGIEFARPGQVQDRPKIYSQ